MVRALPPVVVAFAVAFLAGSPSEAASRVERDLALAPGGRVEVEAEGFEVAVVGSDRTGVHVVVETGSEDLEGRYQTRFEEGGDVVRINVTKRRDLDTGWSWLRGLLGSHRSIAIEMPRRTDLRVSTSGGSVDASDIEGQVRLGTSGGTIRAREIGGPVVANTSGGSIDVAEIRGDVEADTSGGSIRAEAVGGRLTASTSGGSVRARSVSGDIGAATSGGSISVEGAGGRVDASTSGGSVSVAFLRGNSAGGRLETSGGTVTVRIDPAADIEIVAEATGGVDADGLPVVVSGKRRPDELRGVLGAGGSKLEARSSGGSVRIQAIEPAG